MLILESKEVPQSAEALIGIVDRSIRRWIAVPQSTRLLEVSGELPRLSTAKVNLTGGTADTNRGTPPYELTPATEPGPAMAAVAVNANPLTIDGIAFNLNLTAENVVFGYAKSKDGQLVATLESADNGKLSIQLTKQNLEAAILKAAQTGAASSGVAILKVDAALTAIRPRVLDVKLNITAKKFVSAVIRITGRLSLDDQLNATASDLKADGDGMVGSIAVGFLRPHLQKLQGKPISLIQLSLGKVHLHDVAVNTENGLAVTASFG
jgi:hypothetical protein